MTRPNGSAQRIGISRAAAETLRRLRRLVAAEGDHRRLAGVALVERENLRRGGPVHHVHEGRVETIGESQGGEAAVVVDNLEGPLGFVDRIEGGDDVIGLVDRQLDLVGVRVLERRLDVGGRA
jgi:hypothetical protein